MDKYCTNCGKEINIESDYCLKCGKRIIKKNVFNNKNNLGVIVPIISLFLGIISFYISFILGLTISQAAYELNDIIYTTTNHIIIYKFIFAFFYCIIPLAFALPGLITSIISLRKEKNIYACIGLVSSLISLVFCIVIIIFLIK